MEMEIGKCNWKQLGFGNQTNCEVSCSEQINKWQTIRAITISIYHFS